MVIYSVIHKRVFTPLWSLPTQIKEAVNHSSNSTTALLEKIMARWNFFGNAIVEFEEWLTASTIRVVEVWKLFCGLQNKLRKALLFSTKYLNCTFCTILALMNTSSTVHSPGYTYIQQVLIQAAYKLSFWVILVSW